MKKVVAVTVVLIIFLLSATVCFAGAPSDGNSPYYVGTQSHVEIFKISSGGEATMNTSLEPFSLDTVDSVNVTLVIKNSYGTKVYNKSYDMPWSTAYGSFKLIKEHQLTQKGIYEFQATYKCYKGSTLVETIKSNSILKSY